MAATAVEVGVKAAEAAAAGIRQSRRVLWRASQQSRVALYKGFGLVDETISVISGREKVVESQRDTIRLVLE